MLGRIAVSAAALLVLVASLVTRLARGLVRARSRLELAQYRSELAAEMHDGLQQYLGAIAMRMEMADRVAERNPKEALGIAASVKSISRQASDELRLMLHRLRAPILDKGTLADALSYQAALFGERSSLPVNVAVEGTPRRLDPKVEHALLRITQEAVNNAAKHAEATQVDVRLTFEPGAVELLVSDNGKGFDPSTIQEGMGTETIRNRAHSVGGEANVEGQAGTGTKVTVRVSTPA